MQGSGAGGSFRASEISGSKKAGGLLPFLGGHCGRVSFTLVKGRMPRPVSAPGCMDPLPWIRSGSLVVGAFFCFSLAMGRIIQAGEIHAVKLFPRGSSGVRLDRGSMRQCFLSPLMEKLAFPDSMKCPMCSSVAFGKRIFLYKSFGPYSYIGHLFFSAYIAFKAAFSCFGFPW